MHLVQLVRSTSEPAFVVDHKGRIVAWNAAAAATFGYTDAQVLGRLCWQMLQGQDDFGNRYCADHCPLLSMAREHEATHRCRMRYLAASGQWLRVEVSTLAVDEVQGRPGGLVHLLTPIAEEATVPGRSVDGARRIGSLTGRELQVLGLLVRGKSSKSIALELGLSPATVRNHVQHVLTKLHVHSRLEAVSVARNLGLI